MLTNEQLLNVTLNSKPKGLTSQQAREKAEQEFRQLAQQRCDDILSEYVNSRTKVKMKNRLTGKEFEITPSAYKQRPTVIRFGRQK